MRCKELVSRLDRTTLYGVGTCSFRPNRNVQYRDKDDVCPLDQGMGGGPNGVLTGDDQIRDPDLCSWGRYQVLGGLAQVRRTRRRGE